MDCKPPPALLSKLEQDCIFPLKKKSSRFVKARYICRLCEYHCDTVDICLRHMHDSRHLQQKEAKILEEILKSFPYVATPQTDVISQIIHSVREDNSLSFEDRKTRDKVKNELQKIVQTSVPGCSLQTTGSVLSGFALKTSDLNLDVIVPEHIKTATALLAILKIINENDLYCEIENKLSSSYPCLRFTHKLTVIRIEVGIPSAHAYQTNMLLHHYNSLDSRVTPIVTAFRFWAKLCQIDQQQRGTLPSHSFPLMAVHFLQQTTPPVLPSLHSLYLESNPNNQNEKYIEPEDLNPPWSSKNTESIGKLWVDLFKYYSVDFKMAHFVVNIRFNEPLLRKERMWGKKLAIEDPYQTKRNLTRTVSGSSVFDYIFLCFKVTYRYFVIPQLHYGPLFGRVICKDFQRNEITENEDYYDDNGEKIESIGSAAFEKTNYVESLRMLNVNPIDKLYKTKTMDYVTWHTAVQIMKQLKKENLVYRFSDRIFTNGRKPPVQCSICQKLGHDKSDCKEYELPPLAPLGVTTPNYFKTLTRIFQDLKNECAPSIKEVANRDSIVQDLQNYICQYFNGAILELFGSSENGFGFGQSDLDICLMFEGYPTGENLDHIQVIEELAEKLKLYHECKQVLAITTAKVPIVKFMIKRANLDADLSLYNTLALENTKLLRTYANIDSRVQILGYVMKYFAKLCDICDASRGSLSSYAYTLMVIHFLQQCDPPVIPVLQKLHPPVPDNESPPEKLIDSWNAWFFSDISALPNVWPGFKNNTKNVGELWLDLLCYYTEVFNWDDHIVTIRQFEPLSRLEKLWTTQCIAIEDPFDLSHNLGAGLSRKMNTFIRKAFIRGRDVFGAGHDAHPSGKGYKSLVDYLFNVQRLTDGAPPNDRGCRFCGKIGHLIRDCPNKKQKKKKDENGPTNRNNGQQRTRNQLKENDRSPHPRVVPKSVQVPPPYTEQREYTNRKSSSPVAISTDLLFQMAHQLGGGAVSLPTSRAGHYPKSNPIPPPGFSKMNQGPPNRHYHSPTVSMDDVTNISNLMHRRTENPPSATPPQRSRQMMYPHPNISPQTNPGEAFMLQGSPVGMMPNNMTQPMDGKAFISHFMSQMPSGVTPNRVSMASPAPGLQDNKQTRQFPPVQTDFDSMLQAGESPRGGSVPVLSNQMLLMAQNMSLAPRQNL